VKTFGLFLLAAIAEIVGCYLPYLWFKQGNKTADLVDKPRPNLAGRPLETAVIRPLDEPDVRRRSMGPPGSSPSWLQPPVTQGHQ
jgi:hypothetical protein